MSISRIYNLNPGNDSNDLTDVWYVESYGGDKLMKIKFI